MEIICYIPISSYNREVCGVPKDLELTNLEDLSVQLVKATHCIWWLTSNILLVLKFFEPVTLSMVDVYDPK